MTKATEIVLQKGDRPGTVLVLKWDKRHRPAVRAIFERYDGPLKGDEVLAIKRLARFKGAKQRAMYVALSDAGLLEERRSEAKR